MGIILELLFMVGAIVAPFIFVLVFKWKDVVSAYTIGGILSLLVLLISGPGSLPEAVLRFLFGMLAAGTFYWLVITLIRKLARRTSKKKTINSTTDQDYVICAKCGFEQWKGYQVCQKCGASLV